MLVHYINLGFERQTMAISLLILLSMKAYTPTKKPAIHFIDSNDDWLIDFLRGREEDDSKWFHYFNTIFMSLAFKSLKNEPFKLMRVKFLLLDDDDMFTLNDRATSRWLVFCDGDAGVGSIFLFWRVSCLNPRQIRQLETLLI